MELKLNTEKDLLYVVVQNQKIYLFVMVHIKLSLF